MIKIKKWILFLVCIILIFSCRKIEVAETGGLFIIDGEDAGSTPWEFNSLVETSGNTFSLDAAAKNNGTYGYKALFAGNHPDCYGLKTVVGQTEIYLRGYIYIPSTFSASGNERPLQLFWFRDGTTNVAAIGFESAIGGAPAKWVCYLRGDTPDELVGDWSTDTWHYLEIHWKAGSGANGGAEFWVDGNSKYSNFTIDHSAYEIDAIKIGMDYSAGYIPDNGAFLYFDDIKAAITGPIGAYAIGGGYGGAAATIRQSTMQILRPYEISLPPPDGIITNADRQSIIWAYAGILAGLYPAIGYVTAVFAGEIADAAFAGKLAMAAFAGKKGGAAFAGKKSKATFIGKKGDATFTGG